MQYSSITKTRLENTLAQLGVQTGRSDDGDVVAMFENAQFVFVADDAVTTARSLWHYGTHDSDDQAAMRDLINHLNMTTPLGKTIPISAEYGSTVEFRHHFFHQAGVSDSQLSKMLDLYLQVAFYVFDQFETSFPHLIDHKEA